MKDRVLKKMPIWNIWKPGVTFANTNIKQRSIDPTDDAENLATIQVNNNHGEAQGSAGEALGRPREALGGPGKCRGGPGK